MTQYYLSCRSGGALHGPVQAGEGEGGVRAEGFL